MLTPSHVQEARDAAFDPEPDPPTTSNGPADLDEPTWLPSEPPVTSVYSETTASSLVNSSREVSELVIGESYQEPLSGRLLETGAPLLKETPS